jgi:hypothetical protein
MREMSAERLRPFQRFKRDAFYCDLAVELLAPSHDARLTARFTQRIVEGTLKGLVLCKTVQDRAKGIDGRLLRNH